MRVLKTERLFWILALVAVVSLSSRSCCINPDHD